MRVHPLSGREFQIFKQITAKDRRANRGVSGSLHRFFRKGEYSLYFVCKFLYWLFMAAAAAGDIREYRISNRYLGLALVAGISGALAWGEGNMADCSLVLAGFMIRLITAARLGFPIYRRGMIGAGDIKMAALFIAWLGIRDGLRALAIGFMLGAVLALLKMLRQGSMVKRFLYLSAYIRHSFQSGKTEVYYDLSRDGKEAVIPLGACFFVGAAAAEIWQRL